MKILLIGKDGQIAWELQRCLACLGDLVSVDRRSTPIAIDLANPDSIQRGVMEIKPNLIINAAAYTAVDKAESEHCEAKQINAVAPGILAELAARLGAGLIHYSTDYVFSGNAVSPYDEDAPNGPINVYGRTKLAGEIAIAQIDPPHLIFRTAWVYGLRGRNFLLTMLKLIRTRSFVKVVHDQVGAPTWSRQIAEGTALTLQKCITDGRFRPATRSGVYHMTCEGETSWYGFAHRIRQLGQDNALLPQECGEIHSLVTADYPTPAARPAFSLLCNDKLNAQFGLRLPAWETALEQCVLDLAHIAHQNDNS